MNEELEKIEELVEENNRLLHKLVTDLRWRRLISLAKWVFIIGLTLGLYYYVQPFINEIRSLYESIGVPKGTLNKILPF